MDIQWHGLSCFTIKGKDGTVVTDPYDSKQAGLKLPKISADIVLANSDFDLHHAVTQLSERGQGPSAQASGSAGAELKKELRVFDWPGEYEAKDIIVQGISAYDRPRDKEDRKKDAAERVIIYTIKIDGFRICHLSNLGHKLTPEMLEAIGDTDILLIPIGGNNCLDAQKAHEVVEQIDPRVVIPMYYKVPESTMQLDTIDAFLKEVGLHAPTREKTLKFSTPSALPQEQTEFKILEPVTE